METSDLRILWRSVRHLEKPKTIVRTGCLPHAVWPRVDCAAMLHEWRSAGYAVRRVTHGAESKAYWCDESPRVLYVLGDADASALAKRLHDATA